jgi:5-aminolevulinate synthase
MDRLSSHISKFKHSCPYLAHTKAKTLRTLASSAHTRYPAISRLTYKATKCPIMGPALVARSHDQIAPGLGSKILQSAGYASVAGNAEIDGLYKKEGARAASSVSATAPAGVCPHSGAAATSADGKNNPALTPGKFTGAGVCPFSGTSAASAKLATVGANVDTPKPVVAAGGFSYEEFYGVELEKKHKDKSYRYFNNINRLAAKFPVAHTARPTDEVDVWCSNDYLGMGRNPAVLETMQ